MNLWDLNFVSQLPLTEKHILGADCWFGEAGGRAARRWTPCGQTNHQHPSHQCKVVMHVHGQTPSSSFPWHSHICWLADRVDLFSGCTTTSRRLRCGCCEPACTADWCVCAAQWSEWPASDLSAPAWPLSARAAHTCRPFPCSRESLLLLPRYAFYTHTQIQVLLHAVLAALLKGLTSTYFTKDAQLSFLIDLTSRANLYFHVSVYHTVLPGRLPQSYFHTMSKFSTDSNRGLAGHQVSI